MNNVTCSICGAHTSSIRILCEYCGAYLSKTQSEEDEKQALIELHNIIQSADTARQIELLKSGFIPTCIEPLIDAGVRTIPFIDQESANNDLVMSAAGRLNSIRIKLAIHPRTEMISIAVKEFDKIIKQHEKGLRTINHIVFGVFLVLVFGIGYAIYRCNR